MVGETGRNRGLAPRRGWGTIHQDQDQVSGDVNGNAYGRLAPVGVDPRNLYAS